MLEEIAILLAAAILVVPLFKKFGLGTVLGYLIAGIIIGPWCLRLITNIDTILYFSEFGVVLLLFIIGLELQPSRLWVLRRTVFGLGSAQVLFTALAIVIIALSLEQNWAASLIIGLAIAMSSTAFILQTLAERNELTTRHGREAFAILLFQDIAVIPLLALIPLLAVQTTSTDNSADWWEILRALIIIAIMIGFGRQVLRLIFRGVTYFGNREIFTAAALFSVVGTALLMSYVGLSMSLGAFLAGVLLADSEFRHQIEAEIEPFKGLLLGLFFIAVGMSVNLDLVSDMPVILLGLALILILIKFTILFMISWLTGSNINSARNLAITLSAGGEFAFLLFAIAGDYQIINLHTVEQLVVIVTLSMMLSPFLFLLNDKLLSRWSPRHEPEFDRIDDAGNPVIIIGFGRFGQVIARILRMRGIRFTALDISPAQVDFVRKFGSKIYYGDASRLELLRAAKVENANLVVLAINNIEKSLKIAGLLREYFPNVPIYARARNRFHVYKLMDLNIKILFRDTYLSSLAMAKEVLLGLGVPATDADRAVTLFRNHDEELLKRQHAIYHDEGALIQSVKQSTDELKNLFETDVADEFSVDEPGTTD